MNKVHEKMTERAELILLRERNRVLQTNLELEFKAYKQLFDWFNERYPDEMLKHLKGEKL